MKILPLLLALSVTLAMSAQEKLLEGFIDPFTGNISYTKHLLSVTGPNGENFPIALSYNNGGIEMEQTSGMVGLGWNLTTPQISRKVNGVPDDFQNIRKNQQQLMPDGSLETKNPDYYGPLYFASFPTKTHAVDYSATKEMDTYTSESRLGENVSYGVNYDNYYVNCPGIGGELTMKLFEYASLENSQTDHTIYKNTPSEYTYSYYDIQIRKFTGQPQLIYKDIKERKVRHELESPPYSSPVYDQEPIKNWELEGYHASTPPGYGGFQGPLTADGKVVNGYYIVYFTNEQINDPTYTKPNFLEASGYSRPSNAGKLIGAIQITAPSGYTYHFSLPEYVYDEKSYAFVTDISGNPQNLYSKSELGSISGPAYAKNWKLTAITGPYFKDNGSTQGVVDADDEGFYIQFNYGKLYDEKNFRMPLYDLVMDQQVPPSKMDIIQSEKYNGKIDYVLTGSYSVKQEEKYYIKSICTETRALLYGYEEKLDANGLENISYSNDNHTTAGQIPELKLKRLILVHRRDAANLVSINNPPSFDSYYNTSKFYQYALLGSTFSQEYSNIVFKEIEFNYDYSLCGNYPGYKEANVTLVTNGTRTTTDANWMIAGFGGCSTTPGKLTLQSVSSFEKNREQILDPLEFSYSSINPDYDPWKKDNWGYYKSDQTLRYGNYTSSTSQEFIDAWLLNRIEQSDGTIIDIEYESDSFERMGYFGNATGTNSTVPYQFFQVTNINYLGTHSDGTWSPSQGLYERQLRFRLTLDGDLSTSYMGTNLSRHIGVALRFDGYCRRQLVLEGMGWCWDRCCDEWCSRAAAPLFDDDPGLGMGVQPGLAPYDCPPEYIRNGKNHMNILQGGEYFNFVDNSTSRDGNLTGMSVVAGSNNQIDVVIREPTYFAELYYDQKSHGVGVADRIICNDCDDNPHQNAYDYANNWINGYITVRPKGVNFGGGARVAEVSLSGLDRGEDIKVQVEYGPGRASIVPDRFEHPTVEENWIDPGGIGWLAEAPILEKSWPGMLFMSAYKKDPLVPEPLVYYRYVNLHTFYNDQEVSAKELWFHGGYEVPKIIRNQVRKANYVAGYGNDWRRHLSIIEDRSNKLGRIAKVRLNDMSRVRTTSYTYERSSDLVEMFSRRIAPNTGSLGKTNAVHNLYDITDNTSVHHLINYRLSKVVEHDLESDVKTTTTYSPWDPLANESTGYQRSNNFSGIYEAIGKQYHPLDVTNVPTHGVPISSRYSSASYTNQTNALNVLVDVKGKRQYTEYTYNVPMFRYKSTDDSFGMVSRSTGSSAVPSHRYFSHGEVEPSDRELRSVTTLIGGRYQPLEVFDPVSGATSSKRYDLEGRLIASSNSSFHSFFFESFETFKTDDQNVLSFPSGTFGITASSSSSNYHTGSKSLKISSMGTFKYHLGYDYLWSSNQLADYEKDLLDGGTAYILKFWTKTNSLSDIEVSIELDGIDHTGSPYITTISHNFQESERLAVNGTWKLVQFKFDLPEGFEVEQTTSDKFLVQVKNVGTGDIYVDDIMLKPAYANVQANVYDAFDRPQYIFGNENMYRRNVYDNIDRTIEVYQEFATGESKTTETEYHYEKY